MTTDKPTWGYEPERWNAAKAQAETALEEIAKTGDDLIFYSDLSPKVTSITFEPEGHDFHGLLGQLSEESDEEGKGMISALVVTKEHKRPGKRFLQSGEEAGSGRFGPGPVLEQRSQASLRCLQTEVIAEADSKRYALGNTAHVEIPFMQSGEV